MLVTLFLLCDHLRVVTLFTPKRKYNRRQTVVRVIKLSFY